MRPVALGRGSGKLCTGSWAWAWALAWATPAPAGAARHDGPAVLPLRNVILYESGVGYFERRGQVQRNAPLGLLVPENHLDDALMTVVVLTADGARVGALTFPSILAPEAALAESPAPFDSFMQDQSILPLISALAGLEAVLVTTDDERVEGRVVGIARVQETAPAEVDLGEDASGSSHPPDAPGTIQVPVVVFLVEGGELRWFKLDEIESLGPADGPSQDALDRAVSALSERRGEAQATVGVNVREGGELAIGYLAEAPVWRVSYRIVFHEGRARIQGWALVHNDTDEDWTNVGVELVEGQPNSYLFPFVTPRFLHREVVPAEDGLEIVPQLAGTNADQLAAGGEYGYGYGYGYGTGSSVGFGRGGAGLVGVGYGGGGSAEASPLIDFGESAAVVQAEAEQRRELLAYRATEPLSLRARESALVPVIDSPVSAERISLVGPDCVVLAAIKLSNDTGYALRQGPLAVFDAGFAGQTWLPRMYVDDGRVLPHGNDLDVAAWPGDTRTEDEPRVVRWMPARDRGAAARGEGRLEEHYLHRTRRAFELTSHASTDRVVFIRVPPLTNGRVISGEPVEMLTAEDGNDYHHVRLDLAAGEELTHQLTTEEGLLRSWTPDVIDAGTVRGLSASLRLPEEMRGVLRDAAAALEEEVRLRAEAAAKEEQITIVSSEIARHRVDLQALAGSGADEEVATGIAERMTEAGQRLDRLAADARQATEAAATARQRGLTILRTLVGVEAPPLQGSGP